MKRALVILAPGFEEIEALTPADYLRRAGVRVTLASLEGSSPFVTGRSDIAVKADASLQSIIEGKGGAGGTADYDCLVLPGGMPGSKHLASDPRVAELAKDFLSSGRILGAICAAPALVLGGAGLLEGRRFTCFPRMENEVEEKARAGFTPDPVVVDGNMVTSRAAGTAGEFAVALVALLMGESAANEVSAACLVNRSGR